MASGKPGAVQTRQKAARDQAKTQASDLKSVLEAYEQARIAAISGGGSAATRATIEANDKERVEAVKEIASHVEDIVENAYKQSAMVDLCPSFLASLATGAASATYLAEDGNHYPNPLLNLCDKVAEAATLQALQTN